jgi:soluble lytic murein transglycosylase
MSVYAGKSFLHSGLLRAFFICSLLPSFISCSTAKHSEMEKAIQPRKSDFTLVSTGSGPHLSEAIKNNQSTKKLDESRKVLLKFVSQKSGESNYQKCIHQFKNAPECLYLKPDWNQNFFVEEVTDTDDSKENDKEEQAIKVAVAKKSHQHKKKKSKGVAEVVKNIQNGVLTHSPHQQEGDYYRALKSFRQWSPELEALSAKLQKEENCADIELYNYLGLKAEEFFPDEAMLKNSIALYRKADECAQKDPKNQMNRYVQNARFRLGLLSIMKDDCTEAQQVFGRLSKMGANDFSTRALYWSAYCSKADSKPEAYLATFDQLFKMNPLGFHTLSMTSGTSLLIGNLNQPIDPVLKVRANGETQYNIWIEAIEDLDVMGNTQGVRRLLSPVRLSPEYLGTLEPGVRLYLSTFAFRAKDSFSLFRILDSVFRTQSEYVVDSTLKLFYPLKYLQYISENVSRVNPFLITALIRQESAFQEEAHSRVGAVGLMQLMPRTAKLMDRTVNRKKLFNPETNLRIGIRYFESLVDRFQGDVELALAGYNAGPEAVDRWKKRYPMTNRLLFLDLIPYSETRNYVTLIGRNYYWYSKIYVNDAKTIVANSMSFPVDFKSLNFNAKQ